VDADAIARWRMPDSLSSQEPDFEAVFRAAGSACRSPTPRRGRARSRVDPSIRRERFALLIELHPFGFVVEPEGNGPAMGRLHGNGLGVVGRPRAQLASVLGYEAFQGFEQLEEFEAHRRGVVHGHAWGFPDDLDPD
jgi:hypothetical protein